MPVKKINLIKKHPKTKITKQSQISIELDSGCIKAIQLRILKKGGILLEKVAVEELSYFTYNEVPDIIKSFLKKNGFKKTEVVSCLTRSLCTIRFMSLPSLDTNELQEMVSFQAIKQIPYNKEDMIVDFEIISQSNDGYSNVLIAIAHKNVIYQHLDAIENSGLTTNRIDINSQAILRAYLYLKNQPSTDNPDSKPDISSGSPQNAFSATALVDIDYTHTNIQIIAGDKLLFTRGITLGIMHLLVKTKKFQAESANINWQSELMDELRRSFSVFSREQSQYIIDKIVISGGYHEFQDIERNLNSRFQIPVEIFNINDKIKDFSKFDGKYSINDKNISIMAPIGLLIPPASKPIDMVPKDIKSQLKSAARISKIFVACTLFIGLLITGSVNFYYEINKNKAVLSKLQGELNQFSPRVKKLEGLREKINLIKGNIGDSTSCLDYLRELYVVIPEKISLSIFSYDESKYVIIKGTADNMSDVFDLIPKLEDSAYFEKVSSRGVKRRKVLDKEVVDFEIQCSIVKSEEQS